METIEERLQTLFAEKFGERPQLTDSLAGLGVDSVGMAELTVELESQFGIRVGDEVVYVDSVQDLADYVRQRLVANDSESC